MVSQPKTKEEIIDLVFKDPEVKHGLRIFPLCLVTLREM